MHSAREAVQSITSDPDEGLNEYLRGPGAGGAEDDAERAGALARLAATGRTALHTRAMSKSLKYAHSTGRRHPACTGRPGARGDW